MTTFYLALSTVFPLCLYMVIGGLVRRAGIMQEEHFKALNKMMFRLFIPLSLFVGICKADVRSVIDPPVYLYCEILVIAAFLIIRAVLMKRFGNEKAAAATLVQGSYRSNFVLFGSAIAVSLCNSEGAAMIAALTAVIVPTFNILAVILFETAKGGKVPVRHLIVQVFKNPLVDAGFLGLLVSLSGIPIPELIMKPLTSLGNAATPVALVTLGGLLSLKSVMGHRQYLQIACVLRLLVVPGLALLGAWLIGFREAQMVAVLAVFGSPTAVASAPMAQSMGGDGALGGEIVAATTVFSILSIFAWVVFLSGTGLI